MPNYYTMTLENLGRLMDYYRKKYENGGTNADLETFRTIRRIWQQRQADEYI